MTESTHPFEESRPYDAADLRDLIEKGRSQGDKAYNFGGKELWQGGLDYLAHLLTEEDDVHVLNLSSNQLRDGDIPALIGILRKSPNLFHLKLNNNYITSAGLKMLDDAIRGSNELSHLEVSVNPLGPEAGETLAGMLRDYPYLIRLGAHMAQLGDDGVRPIGEALRDNHRVRHIDLNKNRMTVEGAQDFLEAVRHNRALTHIHLKQENAAVDHYISQESATFRSPNLLEVSPLNMHNRPVFMRNLTAAKEAANLLGQQDLSRLSQDALLQIAVRDNAIFSARTRFLLPGGQETTRDAHIRYETFIRSLPKLPPAGPDFEEALFSEDKQGFAPLDNPRLYRAGGIFLDRWRESGIAPSKAFLSRPTSRGSTLLEVAAKTVPGERLIPFLNDYGVTLGAGELLDTQGKPNALMRAFLDYGNAVALFTEDNWAGKTKEELQKVYAALPPDQRQKIAYQSLQLQLHGSPSRATGSLGR